MSASANMRPKSTGSFAPAIVVGLGMLSTIALITAADAAIRGRANSGAALVAATSSGTVRDHRGERGIRPPPPDCLPYVGQSYRPKACRDYYPTVRDHRH
jgi:hypothetical protein